jgi:hypothetical protein
MKPFENIEGLWFVNHLAQKSWEPNSTQSGDPGFRNLRDVQYFEQVLAHRQGAGR